MQKTKRYYPKTGSMNKVSEEELMKRLYMTLAVTAIVIVGLVVSLLFFAPKVGGLFGFLSMYRNEPDLQNDVIPLSPAVSDVPTSTNQELLSITGYSEPASTVKLYLNGPEVQSTVSDNDGVFTFTNVKLIKGKNTLFTKAVSDGNKESEASQVFTVHYDDKAPTITVEEPNDGDTVRNLDKRLMVRGSVSEKATVRVNNMLAVVKPDLTFEILLGVEEGNVEIIIEATDQAGNKQAEKINITYEKKSN